MYVLPSYFLYSPRYFFGAKYDPDIPSPDIGGAGDAKYGTQILNPDIRGAKYATQILNPDISTQIF